MNTLMRNLAKRANADEYAAADGVHRILEVSEPLAADKQGAATLKKQTCSVASIR